MPRIPSFYFACISMAHFSGVYYMYGMVCLSKVKMLTKHCLDANSFPASILCVLLLLLSIAFSVARNQLFHRTHQFINVLFVCCVQYIRSTIVCNSLNTHTQTSFPRFNTFEHKYIKSRRAHIQEERQRSTTTTKKHIFMAISNLKFILHFMCANTMISY